MDRVFVAYSYSLGHYVNGLALLRNDSPMEQRGAIIFPALEALKSFTGDKRIVAMIPRSAEAATEVLGLVSQWANGKGVVEDLPILQHSVAAFSLILTEELGRGHVYQFTNKGNLSVDSLAAGASNGYPRDTLMHLDDFITREIDEAGKCLLCGRYTATGFHILRSVETGMKAYVHAATGSLPPIPQRSWGTYIKLLEQNRASQNLIISLRILNTKRNPLMHPKDSLSESEAIDILCICQAVTTALIEDVKSKEMTDAWATSLRVLPAL